MANVLKQVQLEVGKFKARFIAPEVLQEMAPKLREDYLKAVQEYRLTPQYKKVIEWHAKHSMNESIRNFFQDEKFQRRVFKVIAKSILKEFNDGDK